MAKIIRINGFTSTDTSAPKIIERDAIESDGSLVLVDFSHQLGGVSGVPASTGSIPNVLWEKASAILGAGTQSSLSCGFLSAATPAEAIFERTLKLGLHGIYSQIANNVSNHGAVVYLSNQIRDYIIANKTHRFYVSHWSQRTRAALSTGHRFSEIGSAGNFLFYMNSAQNTSRVAGSSKNDGGFNVIASRFNSIEASALAGNNVSVLAYLHVFGNYGSSTNLTNVCPSDVFYRGYIEDLTVSGRTYAEVEAIDYALYQAAFAPGGKFYGDTYTDPATLP